MTTPTHPLQAFSLAILLEAILLLGVGVVMAGAENEKPVLKPVTITLLNEEKLLEKPPEKQPEKVPKKQPEPKLAKPKVVQRQTPRPPVTPLPVEQALPVAQLPTAFTRPEPLPVATPVPDTSKAKISNLYAAKVHAAVQTAHYYPPAAAALRYSGRVRVAFHLRDGVPANPQLLVPSGYGIIDRAALSAVQNAQYPEPPQELRGEDMVYQVWVEFTLQ